VPSLQKIFRESQDYFPPGNSWPRIHKNRPRQNLADLLGNSATINFRPDFSMGNIPIREAAGTLLANGPVTFVKCVFHIERRNTWNIPGR
jgi:hypothetical protein